MTAVQVRMPEKLLPVFEGEADVRGAKGGRGSAKTRSFATMTAVKGLVFARAGIGGILLMARQFMNSLADSSFAEIKAAIEETPWLAPYYDIGEKYIRTKCGKVAYAFTGLDRNIDSIKSKARILLCWIDEAEPVTEEAWTKLIPTLRTEGDDFNAELWLTWNPESKRSATNKRFGKPTDSRVKIVEINWRDNPWFPKILERQRQRDLKERPDQYDHIWEGAFKGITEGAYYAPHLIQAKAEGRIREIYRDPLMEIRAFFDIGGTGKRADAVAIWIVQFIGERIHVLDYYEAQGQEWSAHVTWLRKRGYANCHCVLPHDGTTNDTIFDVNPEGYLKKAGFSVTVIKNQGPGAAMQRVDATRGIFHRISFSNALKLDDHGKEVDATEAGREALESYCEKRDPKRPGVGLGPDHNWASHGADAFGIIGITYEEPRQKISRAPRRSSSPWAA